MSQHFTRHLRPKARARYVTVNDDLAIDDAPLRAGWLIDSRQLHCLVCRTSVPDATAALAHRQHCVPT